MVCEEPSSSCSFRTFLKPVWSCYASFRVLSLLVVQSKRVCCAAVGRLLWRSRQPPRPMKTLHQTAPAHSPFVVLCFLALSLDVHLHFGRHTSRFASSGVHHCMRQFSCNCTRIWTRRRVVKPCSTLFPTVAPDRKALTTAVILTIAAG